MCIIFIYTGDGLNCKYKAIIASNRDEFVDRPTKSACRWTQDETVIGGQDMKDGKGGGTWLAISGKRRKLAALLNLPAKNSSEAKPRGFLVTDFVVNDIKSENYMEKFNKTHQDYNPFNLVTVELNQDDNKIFHYNNLENDLHSFGNGFYSFGNCTIDQPFQKVLNGREKFENIILNNSENSEALIKELLDLLKWDTLHLPDKVIENNKFYTTTKVASVFVNLPPDNTYGTRTHTIILVDNENKIDYFEWTRIQNQTEWAKTHIIDKLG